ncbi:MAG: excisionase family DNA-binding protein [Cyclonatronaceae bacterium]
MGQKPKSATSGPLYQGRIDGSLMDHDEMDRLVEIMEGTKRPALVGRKGEHLELPELLYQMLIQVVHAMKSGKAVIIMPEDETYTTQAAADFLGMSRQYFVKLLEQGAIPFHKVGSHRRVYLRDLMAYASKRDKNRRKSLDKLFSEVEKEGVYDNYLINDEKG